MWASVPESVAPAQRLPSIPGAVPALGDLPPGCRFHPRCPHAVAGRCDTAAVTLMGAPGTRAVRCVRSAELAPPRVAS
jgi:oligopeptide/dipeptide ABC transporter ATP-binding protein